MRDDARQGGFTLIELMIVIAIIGILAATAAPKLAATAAGAKNGRLLADLHTLDSVLLQYYVDHDQQFPGALEELAPPTGGGARYLRDIPRDAQDDALAYTVDNKLQTYDLSGKKADGTVVHSPGSGG